MLDADRLMPIIDRLITNMNSHIGVETSPNEPIPGTRLILDWVPVGVGRDNNAGAEVEPDFGARFVSSSFSSKLFC